MTHGRQADDPRACAICHFSRRQRLLQGGAPRPCPCPCPCPCPDQAAARPCPLLMTAWQLEHDAWQTGGRSQGLCHLPFLQDVIAYYREGHRARAHSHAQTRPQPVPAHSPDDSMAIWNMTNMADRRTIPGLVPSAISAFAMPDLDPIDDGLAWSDHAERPDDRRSPALPGVALHDFREGEPPGEPVYSDPVRQELP